MNLGSLAQDGRIATDSMPKMDSIIAKDTVAATPVVELKDTLLTPEYWVQKLGLAEVKTKQVVDHQKSFYFLWILGALLLSVVGYWSNFQYFNKIGYSLINVRFSEEFFRDYKKRFSLGIITLDFSWIIGLSLWIDFFLESRGFSVYLLPVMIGVGGVYWLKRQWIWLLGKVTRMDETGDYYLFSLFNYFRWMAPWMAITALFLTFFNQDLWTEFTGFSMNQILFWMIPIMWSLSFVVRLFRVLGKFLNAGFGIFFRFLFYFCVLEIIPTLVIVKWFWK